MPSFDGLAASAKETVNITLDRDFLLVTTEPKELVIVNIAGDVDLKTLSRL